MAKKHFLLAWTVVLVTGTAGAADYFWTNPAGGNFVGNFTPGGTPVSAIDTRLFFPELLALPTGYTAVNNIGSFTLNAMGFQSQWSNNSPATTISAGAAAGFTLRFAANGAIQPRLGFRWLTRSDEHWNWVEAVPPASVRVDGKTAYYADRSYRLFQDATAKVDFVVGEFYWKVQAGETVQSKDYVNAPGMLSEEVTKEGSEG